MRIIIDRKYKKGTYTIGNLSIDGKWECNSLEDKDRGLKQSMTLQQIRELKVYGETAIPTGEYEVRLDIVSPKYKAIAWYNSLCGGKMPRVMNVPGYDGILFHPGSDALDTKGCILVGKNTVRGKVTNSRNTFAAFYRKLEAAAKRGEKITVKIQ